MPRGPERTGIISGGGSKAGPECGNCGICPLAGGGCPRRATVFKFEGLTTDIKVVTGVKEIIANADNGLPRRYVFRSVDGGRPTSPAISLEKKTCSKCGGDPTTCHCGKIVT